jgi:cytidylate kinase
MPTDSNENIPVLTIDGPSGSGKGTIAIRVAAQLGWHFLDSGALYRLTALSALQNQVSLDDNRKIAELARDLDVKFALQEDLEVKILLNNQDVTQSIRTEECGAAASKIATYPELREALLQRQRDYREAPGLVADGRDMGTVVFPATRTKIFLTASAEERAKRRYKQLKEKGLDVNLAALSKDIEARDRQDASRAVAPLKPAEDATVIDTTGMTIDEVVRQVLEIVEANRE